MQEDKSLWITVILLNIFTYSAFFCSPHVLPEENLLHGGKWATYQALDVVLLRVPHTESGLLLVLCECKQASQGRSLARSLLPAVPECVFRHHNLCHSRSSPLGLVLLGRQCAWDLLGTGLRLCLFYKGKQSNFYSWPVPVQRQTNVVVAILKSGGGEDLFHMTLKDPDLQVIVLTIDLSRRQRHKGVLCFCVSWRDYRQVTWYLGPQRLGSVTQMALPVLPFVFLFVILHLPQSVTEPEWNHINMDTAD